MSEERIERINATFDIPSHLASVEDVFNQVYVAENYYSWFNMKPFVWIKFDQEYLDVGCTGRVYFTVPFFSYELSVVEVKKPYTIKLESRGKHFVGNAQMNVTEKDGHILFEDPHNLHGKTSAVHNYYKWFLSGNHTPYMKSRFKKLYDNIIRERVKRQEDGNHISISS